MTRFPVVPFAGQPVRSLKTPAFEYLESAYAAGLRIDRHLHQQAYLGITVSGGWNQEYENHHRAGGPWTVTLHPAGELHSNRFSDSGARILNIKIHPGQFRRLAGDGVSLAQSVGFTGGKTAWIAREIYREFRHADSLSPMLLNGLTLELLAELLRRSLTDSSEPAPAWLLRARDVIETQFADTLCLKSLAAVAGVHPVHLAREFRRRFHRTVGERIRDLRIQSACRLLADARRPIVDVALEVGFSDQASFTHAFRRRTGLTPSEFRRLNPPVKNAQKS